MTNQKKVYKKHSLSSFQESTNGSNIKNTSLIATSEEMVETSKSLYRDQYYRVNHNVGYLRDTTRKNYYLKLLKNASIPLNSKLLHIGCGLGIISMLLIKNKIVCNLKATGMSALTPTLNDIAHDNYLDSISFHRGRIYELLKSGDLKSDDFNIILCEWMDNFLIGKPRMLKEVFTAFDQLNVKNSNSIFPNFGELFVTAISDKHHYVSNVECWNNIYGFTMHSMKDLVSKEVTCGGGYIPKDFIATNIQLIKTMTIEELYNTYKSCEAPDLSYTSSFSLKANRKTTLHYLTFYTSFGTTLNNNESDKSNIHSIGFQPGMNNALSESSVMLNPFFPVNEGDQINGTINVSPLSVGQGVIHSDILVIKVKVSMDNNYGHFESDETYYHSNREEKIVEEK